MSRPAPTCSAWSSTRSRTVPRWPGSSICGPCTSARTRSWSRRRSRSAPTDSAAQIAAGIDAAEQRVRAAVPIADDDLPGAGHLPPGRRPTMSDPSIRSALRGRTVPAARGRDCAAREWGLPSPPEPPRHARLTGPQIIRATATLGPVTLVPEIRLYQARREPIGVSGGAAERATGRGEPGPAHSGPSPPAGGPPWPQYLPDHPRRSRAGGDRRRLRLGPGGHRRDQGRQATITAYDIAPLAAAASR